MFGRDISRGIACFDWCTVQLLTLKSVARLCSYTPRIIKYLYNFILVYFVCLKPLADKNLWLRTLKRVDSGYCYDSCKSLRPYCKWHVVLQIKILASINEKVIFPSYAAISSTALNIACVFGRPPRTLANGINDA